MEQVSLNAAQSLRFRYPFIHYAARNWHVHVRKASLEAYDVSDMIDIMDELLEDKSIIKWVKLEKISYRTPLEIAVSHGLTDMV